MTALIETPDLSNRFALSRKQILFQLRARPWNLHWSSITMFFLNINVPMRRDIASRFIIFNSDHGGVRAERFENDLSAFAAPDFDNILMHELVGIFAGADGNSLPGDLHFVTITSCLCPTWTGIIWRYRQFQTGIYNGKHFRVALNIQKLGVHPTIIVPIIVVLICHPNPIVGVGASDQFYVCGSIECK